MAQNLLIRELDQATNKALDRLKQQRDIKANTDAALTMINEYWGMKTQIAEMQQELSTYRSLFDRLAVAKKELTDATEVYERVLKDVADKSPLGKRSVPHRFSYEEE